MIHANPLHALEIAIRDLRNQPGSHAFEPRIRRLILRLVRPLESMRMELTSQPGSDLRACLGLMNRVAEEYGRDLGVVFHGDEISFTEGDLPAETADGDPARFSTAAAALAWLREESEYVTVFRYSCYDLDSGEHWPNPFTPQFMDLTEARAFARRHHLGLTRWEFRQHFTDMDVEGRAIEEHPANADDCDEPIFAGSAKGHL